jgi:hypothetical protein
VNLAACTKVTIWASTTALTSGLSFVCALAEKLKKTVAIKPKINFFMAYKNFELNLSLLASAPTLR